MKTLKNLLFMMALVLFGSIFTFTPVKAEENSDTIITVPITVQEEYSMANDLFQIINKNRANLSVDNYKLDEGLTEMAMERAAELCIYFRHKSLTSDNTALTDKELANPLIGNKFSYSAEDISDGTADAKSTYAVWYKSDTHRPALINENYKYCGIGVVTYHNKIKWSLIVSSVPGGKEISGVSGSKEVTRDIDAKAKYFTRKNITAYDMKKEEDPFQFSDLNGGSMGYMLEKAGLFTFKNNSPDLIDIDEWGRCQAKANGAGSFTVYYKNNIELCTVNVSAMCFNLPVQSETSSEKETETPSQSESTKQTEPSAPSETKPSTDIPKETDPPKQTDAPKQTNSPKQTNAPKQTETQKQSEVTAPKQTDTVKANANGLTVKVKNVVYNKKAQKPAVTVYVGKTKLSKKNYSVTYKNNKNVGYGSVIVRGKGKYAKYSGTGTFKISLKNVSLSSVKAGKKKLTASWQKTGGNQGFQLQCSTSKDFSNAKVLNLTAGKKSTTIKNLESKKYYVRIRSYKKVKNEIWYTKWSKAKGIAVE